MIDIFLSASVPLPERNARFYRTADVMAIREAIKGLVEVVLPIGRITFGGHPAITPLIAYFVARAGLDSSRFTIFQSQFFEGQFPAENSEFVNVRLTPAATNRHDSLEVMRHTMIESRPFKAAIFIGGMEGIFDEARIFKEAHPTAMLLPVPTTGAAAEELYNAGTYPSDLRTDLTYATLFRRYLTTKR